MKHLVVQIEDDTKTELVKNVQVNHLSDLGDGVRDAIEDFMLSNEGAMMPPLCIRVAERRDAGCGS